MSFWRVISTFMLHFIVLDICISKSIQIIWGYYYHLWIRMSLLYSLKTYDVGNVARQFVCSFIIISKQYTNVISQYAGSEFRCNYVPLFADGAWKVFVYVNGGATANFIHWMNLNFLLCFFLVRIWNNTFKKNTYYLAIIFLFRGISKVGFILTKA